MSRLRFLEHLLDDFRIALEAELSQGGASSVVIVDSEGWEGIRSCTSLLVGILNARKRKPAVFDLLDEAGVGERSGFHYFSAATCPVGFYSAFPEDRLISFSDFRSLFALESGKEFDEFVERFVGNLNGFAFRENRIRATDTVCSDLMEVRKKHGITDIVFVDPAISSTPIFNVLDLLFERLNETEQLDAPTFWLVVDSSRHDDAHALSLLCGPLRYRRAALPRIPAVNPSLETLERVLAEPPLSVPNAEEVAGSLYLGIRKILGKTAVQGAIMRPKAWLGLVASLYPELLGDGPDEGVVATDSQSIDQRTLLLRGVFWAFTGFDMYALAGFLAQCEYESFASPMVDFLRSLLPWLGSEFAYVSFADRWARSSRRGKSKIVAASLLRHAFWANDSSTIKNLLEQCSPLETQSHGVLFLLGCSLLAAPDLVAPKWRQELVTNLLAVWPRESQYLLTQQLDSMRTILEALRFHDSSDPRERDSVSQSLRDCVATLLHDYGSLSRCFAGADIPFRSWVEQFAWSDRTSPLRILELAAADYQAHRRYLGPRGQVPSIVELAVAEMGLFCFSRASMFLGEALRITQESEETIAFSALLTRQSVLALEGEIQLALGGGALHRSSEERKKKLTDLCSGLQDVDLHAKVCLSLVRLALALGQPRNVLHWDQLLGSSNQDQKALERISGLAVELYLALAASEDLFRRQGASSDRSTFLRGWLAGAGKAELTNLKNKLSSESSCDDFEREMARSIVAFAEKDRSGIESAVARMVELCLGNGNLFAFRASILFHLLLNFSSAIPPNLVCKATASLRSKLVAVLGVGWQSPEEKLAFLDAPVIHSLSVVAILHGWSDNLRLWHDMAALCEHVSSSEDLQLALLTNSILEPAVRQVEVRIRSFEPAERTPAVELQACARRRYQESGLWMSIHPYCDLTKSTRYLDGIGKLTRGSLDEGSAWQISPHSDGQGFSIENSELGFLLSLQFNGAARVGEHLAFLRNVGCGPLILRLLGQTIRRLSAEQDCAWLRNLAGR